MKNSVGFATFALIALTRWLTAPEYLHSFDAVNFALALDEFDPSHHQPQPPGYLLFVGLIRLIHLAVGDAAHVLAIAGILGSVAAALLAGKLARDMFGTTAMWTAAALLATDPVLWFGSITNPVRVFLAASSAAVAWLAWRALVRPDLPRRLVLAFAGLGVAFGFRPDAALVLLPLLLWVWWQTGGSWRQLATGAIALASLVACWLGILANSVGSATTLWVVCRAYVVEQFRGSSALFGAAAAPASHMAGAAVAWTLLGVLGWIWALPLVRASRAGAWKGNPTFLLIWITPPLLFNVFVHIGDPDQALAGVAAVSVAGAAVLARMPRPYVAAAVAMGIHAATFLFPVGEAMRASSLAKVIEVDRNNGAVLSTLTRLRAGGPATIVYYGGPITFRHLAYYFPDDYVVLLPGTPAEPAGGAPVHVFHRRRPVPPPREVGTLRPGSRRVLCIAPAGAGPTAPGWLVAGPVTYFDFEGRTEVAVGPHKLVPEHP